MKPRNGGRTQIGYDAPKLLLGEDSELTAEESEKVSVYKELFKQEVIRIIRACADELCENILRCGEPKEEE